MPPIGRILKAAAGVLGFVVYVWFAAVRLAPAAKRRKGAKHPR
jgi:hypothetical protein